MNHLINYEKDIKKCSRCGLCNAACPVYQVTKNDCTSPRGKYILISDFLKNKKKLSNSAKKYLRMCLNCGKCTKYCPCKIDMCKINEAYEKDYPSFVFSFSQIPLLIKFIYNYIEQKFNTNIKIPEGKKLVYQKSYSQEKVPEIIKEINCNIVENCGATIKFALNNPQLYKELAILSAKEILKYNPDIILTSDYLCKTQLQTGLKIINAKKNIFLKYLQD